MLEGTNHSSCAHDVYPCSGQPQCMYSSGKPYQPGNPRLLHQYTGLSHACYTPPHSIASTSRLLTIECYQANTSQSASSKYSTNMRPALNRTASQSHILTPHHKYKITAQLLHTQGHCVHTYLIRSLIIAYKYYQLQAYTCTQLQATHTHAHKQSGMKCSTANHCCCFLGMQSVVHMNLCYMHSVA